MINLVHKPIYLKPLLKQSIRLKLKPVKRLEGINIFTIPTRIKDADINSMFNGILALMKEKIKQEQSEKFLRLQLKYNRLKKLYKNIKTQLYTKKNI